MKIAICDDQSAHIDLLKPYINEFFSIKEIKAEISEFLSGDSILKSNEEFDIIFHPVSNVYVEEVKPIFKECYRILKKGGILVCGLDNGINFITNDEEKIENKFPFNPLKNKEQLDSLIANDDGIQFSHTLEEQIGGQLEAGFILTNLYEDTNGIGRLHELNIPSFFATRAIK